MFRFIRDMFSTFVLLLVVFGVLFVVIQVLQGMRTAEALSSGYGGLITAVQVIAGYFGLTWSLHALDRGIFRGTIKNKFGFRPGKPNPFTIFTMPLVHGNDRHLFGNTPYLLLFAGAVALVVPSLGWFLLVTLILLVITGFGMVIFAKKDSNQIGASGMVLGYYSFNLVYPFLAENMNGVVLAVILLLFFGGPMWRVLTNRQGNVSVSGHVLGFLGGIAAAVALPAFGV